jgi:hypothetical protein
MALPVDFEIIVFDHLAAKSFKNYASVNNVIHIELGRHFIKECRCEANLVSLRTSTSCKFHFLDQELFGSFVVFVFCRKVIQLGLTNEEALVIFKLGICKQIELSELTNEINNVQLVKHPLHSFFM